jgi:hypothetical protein
MRRVFKLVLFVIITIIMHTNVSVSRPNPGSYVPPAFQASLNKGYVPPSAPNPKIPAPAASATTGRAEPTPP